MAAMDHAEQNQLAVHAKRVVEDINVLHQYCDIIDRIVKEHNGKIDSCEVLSPSLMIKIGIVLESFEVKRPRNDYSHHLFGAALETVITPYDNEHISILYYFPSVWEDSANE